MNEHWELIKKLKKSDKIRRLYDEYAAKNITFKEWVTEMVHRFYVRRVL